MSDTYTATWVSYSSISDFQRCPRLYYLRNVRKDPESNRKMTIISPPLALGQAVHEVVESLSMIPVKNRFETSLIKLLDTSWEKVSGERGGFSSKDSEQRFRHRAEDMLRRIMDNVGPLGNLAVKIHQDLPHYFLSEDDNIILCGKIDWLEYLPDEDAVHIIDFKTGKGEESPDSLQLPIYTLLVTNTQRRRLAKASYWYLDRDTEPVEMTLPETDSSYAAILKIAKEISLARKLGRFKCAQGTGCMHCKPYESVLRGHAKHVGVNDFGQDVYVLESHSRSDESTIL